MDNRLPEEIAIDIFLRLPAQYVSPSARVCRTWRRLLRGNDFVGTHLRRQLQEGQQVYGDDELYHKAVGSNNGGGGGGANSKVSFLFLAKSYAKTEKKSICYGEYYNERLRNRQTIKKKTISSIKKNTSRVVEDNLTHAIVGSCNGLICFSICHTLSTFVNDPVYIINPITGEEVNLPKFIANGQRQCVTMASGFGYLPSTNEYKVVRITYSTARPSKEIGQAEVYTLGGGSNSGIGGIGSCIGRGRWRNKGEISFYLIGTTLSRTVGILADGALHWLDYNKSSIVAFDLAQEEFFMVPPPPCLIPEERYFLHLKVLGGCLSVVHQMRGERVDIWLFKMNKKNNSDPITKEMGCAAECYSWSWIKEFSIPWEGNPNAQYDPFALTKSGEILLWYDRTILCLYDPKTATTLKQLSSDLGLKVSQAVPHVSSFIPLKASSK